MSKLINMINNPCFSTWDDQTLERVIIYGLGVNGITDTTLSLRLLRNYIEFNSIQNHDNYVLQNYVKEIKEFNKNNYSTYKIKRIVYGTNFLKNLHYKCKYGKLKYYIHRIKYLCKNHVV